MPSLNYTLRPAGGCDSVCQVFDGVLEAFSWADKASPCCPPLSRLPKGRLSGPMPPGPHTGNDNTSPHHIQGQPPTVTTYAVKESASPPTTKNVPPTRPSTILHPDGPNHPLRREPGRGGHHASTRSSRALGAPRAAIARLGLLARRPVELPRSRVAAMCRRPLEHSDGHL